MISLMMWWCDLHSEEGSDPCLTRYSASRFLVYGCLQGSLFWIHVVGKMVVISLAGCEGHDIWWRFQTRGRWEPLSKEEENFIVASNWKHWERWWSSLPCESWCIIYADILVWGTQWWEAGDDSFKLSLQAEDCSLLSAPLLFTLAVMKIEF